DEQATARQAFHSGDTSLAEVWVRADHQLSIERLNWNIRAKSGQRTGEAVPGSTARCDRSRGPGVEVGVRDPVARPDPVPEVGRAVGAGHRRAGGRALDDDVGVVPGQPRGGVAGAGTRPDGERPAARAYDAARTAAGPQVRDGGPRVVGEAEPVPEGAVGEIDPRRVGDAAAVPVETAVVAVLVGGLRLRL